MKRLSILLPLLFANGCYFSTGGGGHQTPVKDFVPTVEWADASCYWDPPTGDFVWWFEADVGDGNGNGDVEAVFADVYDQYNGEWVEAFELYWDGGNTFFSSWQGRSTHLDCEYYQYIVDFTAVDSSGEGPVYALELY